MSIGYTEHELRGMFTEEEIAYGVPYIIYGDYNPDLEYSSEETVEPDSEEIDNMVNEIVAQLYETIKTNSVNINYVHVFIFNYLSFVIYMWVRKVHNKSISSCNKKVFTI